MKTCPECNATYEITANFCGYCKTSLVILPSGMLAISNQASIDGYYISPRKLVLMTLISSGLYLYYWFYITWKQYKKQSGATIYPLWHSLSLVVPILNLFKFHSHVKTYKELTSGTFNPKPIRLGIILFAFIIYKHLLDAWLMIMLILNPSESSLSSTTMIVNSGVEVIALIVLTVALNLIQQHLNNYWDNIFRLPTSKQEIAQIKIGLAETILTVLGLLEWLHMLFMCFNQEYRFLVLESQANLFGSLEANTAD